MSHGHQLQQQRFELKYVIPDAITPSIRKFLRCHLEPDEFTQGRPDYSYPVHSLYLDSRDLYTHHAAVNGQKNRFKLRLRYYNDRPEAPVFFEIKGRVDNCILKQRCGVRREDVPLALTGRIPDPDRLFSSDPKSLQALEKFIALTQRIQARPRVHNTYTREAWVSPEGNSVRVTFDREIMAEPCLDDFAPIRMRHPVRLFDSAVVLELKFTSRFPDFLRELVERFNLMQASSAKYSGAVELIGEESLRRKAPLFEWRDKASLKPKAQLGETA